MRLMKFLVPLLLVSPLFALAQHSEYNLPPGYRLVQNQTVFDLSGKLNNSMQKSIPADRLKVLKDIPENELRNAPSEYQEYVNNGKLFMASLSPRVKSIYSEVELWYIYAFDQKLKGTLLTLN